MEKDTKRKLIKILLIIIPTVIIISYMFAPSFFGTCKTGVQLRIYNLLYSRMSFFMVSLIFFIWLSLFAYLLYADSVINKTRFIKLILVFLLIFPIALILIVISLNNTRNLNPPQKKIADLKQLRTALDLYYEDYSVYPDSLEELLKVRIIAAMPHVPGKENKRYGYKTSENRKNFVVWERLDDECKFKTRGSISSELNRDVDGIVYDINCNDPVYCLKSEDKR